MNNYLNFLNNKPLFYDKIDYDRMPRVWKRIKSNFKLPKIIHIVGTNGKGSTGRFLAHYLYKSGFKVGHYSSPHIIKFNERIWINAHDVKDEKLQKAHNYLLKILNKEELSSLSYFEYTTIMAIYLFQDCDYAIMEAGMGGEFDATQVFEKILTIVTTIDYDHQEFLGKDIKEIALTKMKSINKTAIIGKQIHHDIKEIAKYISSQKSIKTYDYLQFLDKSTKKKIKDFAIYKNFPAFLEKNLLLAMATIKFLNIKIDTSLLNDIFLFGRCQKIDDNITIDVGHNPLAAKALKDYFKDKKIILIYNSYKDKDYRQILQILKPIIKKIEILPVKSSRIEKIENIQTILEELKIANSIFQYINKKEKYLVFGSFAVIEDFLKRYKLER